MSKTEIKTDSTITVEECRKLRNFIYEFTKAPFLTVKEYVGIITILDGAVKRLVEEGMVHDDRD